MDVDYIIARMFFEKLHPFQLFLHLFAMFGKKADREDSYRTELTETIEAGTFYDFR